MTQQVVVEGAPAWRKSYEGGGRRLRLAALDLVARGLDLPPLRPPPYHPGRVRRAVEKRRIRSLQSIGVTVPEILDEQGDCLLLSDIGPTLSSRLREAGDDAGRLDALSASAIAAIAGAHGKGGYFSQAWPRNLTVHAGGIGFLDFEEDPLEIMSLEHAQARDWLLFAYGTMRYYPERPDALAGMLREALADAAPETRSVMARVAARLRPMADRCARCGPSARAFSQVLGVIRSALPILLCVLLVCLGLDWIDDGRLGLIEDLFQG